jgi:hypothetical protein
MLHNHHAISLAHTLDTMGIHYTEYPPESLRLSNGIFIHSAALGVNSSALSATTSWKETIISFLDRIGERVIPTEVYYKADLITQYGAPIDNKKPCIVKPNRGHGGIYNRIFVSSDALESAKNFAQKQQGGTLVEEFIEGYEVRVLSVKGKIFQAIKKTPLILVGDGVSDIVTLYTNLTSQYPASSAKDTTFQKFIAALQKLGIPNDFILEPLEELDFTKSNYSAISLYSPIDILDPIIQKLHDLIIQEFPLQFAGMDFLVDPEGVVWYLETNSRPGLRMFELFDQYVREKVLREFV